jgi:hypothetical protein
MEGLGWKSAAYNHTNDASACSGLVQRSDILAFGAATGTYLLIVVVQLVVLWLLSSVKLPVFGNTESPCDSFMCALSGFTALAAVAQGGCIRLCIAQQTAVLCTKKRCLPPLCIMC